MPPFRPEPEAAHVKAALELLQKAERPIIVAGGGVRASGAARELVALAEALQIPVATSLNGKDCIPGTHPLSVGVVGSYSRESANRAVNRADLVCFIGTETGGMTTHFWAVPKIGTPAIQIDIEPEALGRNYPLQASVLGDAKAVLSAMLASRPTSRARRSASPGSRKLPRCAASGTPNTRPTSNSDAVPIHPARICGELTQHMPDDAHCVVDTGHAGMWMGGMYDLRSADAELHAQRRPSRLGVSRPASAPRRRVRERPVVVFTGDAGFWYHIAEVETAVRWKINSVTIVNNNGGGNQSKRGFDRAYGGEQTAKVARIVDLQPDEFRQARRGHGRARHPRRARRRYRTGAGSARWRPTVRR